MEGEVGGFLDEAFSEEDAALSVGVRGLKEGCYCVASCDEWLGAVGGVGAEAEGAEKGEEFDEVTDCDDGEDGWGDAEVAAWVCAFGEAVFHGCVTRFSILVPAVEGRIEGGPGVGVFELEGGIAVSVFVEMFRRTNPSVSYATGGGNVPGVDEPGVSGVVVV